LSSTKLPSSPKAILIDLDGTLADSMAVMRVSYQKFLERFQAKTTDEEFAALNGPPLVEVVRRLKITHSLEGDIETLLATYFDIIDLAYSRVAPSPGADALLARAKENHCSVGIVTSNSLKRTQMWLDAMNFSHLISFIVSGEDVLRGKPNPEPYLQGIKKAECHSSSIIAVEDSTQGARSAVDAGLRTFLLTETDTSDDWPAGVLPVRSLYQLTDELFGRVR